MTKTGCQSFIRSRTGQDAQSKKKKQHYISLLQQLDEDAQFIFQDLAPELRNLIYRELLSLEPVPTGLNVCYTSFPATSKQIREEASSILYGDTQIWLLLHRYGSQHSARAGIPIQVSPDDAGVHR